MKTNYSFKNTNDNMAKAYGRDLSISTKHSVEICNRLRGKQLDKAKSMLEKVIAMEQPIKMTRHVGDLGHKRGIGPGRYPVNAAKGILAILKSAESNALNKGLSTADLQIIHVAAHRAARPWHYGRQRRRKMKRTHIEIVLSEIKQGKTDAKKKKISEPEGNKTKTKETKPEQKENKNKNDEVKESKK